VQGGIVEITQGFVIDGTSGRDQLVTIGDVEATESVDTIVDQRFTLIVGETQVSVQDGDGILLTVCDGIIECILEAGYVSGVERL
jgi:hypothetical protein